MRHGVQVIVILKIFYLIIKSSVILGLRIRGSGVVTVCIRKSSFDFFQISRIYPHVKESVLLYLVSPFEEQKDIVIIYTYVAPEHSAIYTVDEPNGIKILQGTVDTVISEYSNVNILLPGDFNARTSNNLDYIPHDDISFVFNDSNTDYPSDIFNLDRSSKDKKNKQVWFITHRNVLYI